MKYRLRVTAAAAEDMEDAVIWYENQQSGLGQKFLLAVGKGFNIVQSAPERYPYADEDKVRRRYLLPTPFRSSFTI